LIQKIHCQAIPCVIAPPATGPRGDQEADVRRQCAGGRSDREQPEPEREQPSSPEAIAERCAGHEQHGEAQRVGVDDPFQLLHGGPEMQSDRAQRGGHHQDVQRDHHRRY